MNWIYRELAGIVLPIQATSSAEDAAAINALPNPPLVPLTLEDVHIRRCRLAGDAIDAGFGRFRTADLPRLLRLVQGAPALIGHRRDSLGVARFFGGEIACDLDSGISYIVPKFYWMKRHSGAEDLRLNIDGGLYNEASIGFTFTRPMCGLCGEDIRRCEHIPGNEYDGKLCFFFYDDILRVTEGSFVYRGAQPGTGFMLSEGFISAQYPTYPRFRYKGIEYIGV